MCNKHKFKEPCQLHNHSAYSLLDAVPTPKEWLGWCLKTGTPGFSITDHGTAISMYDMIQFPKYIEEYNKKNGTDYAKDAVIGVPGVELYVKMNKEDKSHYHITVWATSNIGYTNLMKLSSLAFDDTVSYYGNVKGRVTFDLIQKYKEGLKFGTGCIASPIGQAIMREDNYALAEERFLMYREMFGDDLYIEFHPTDVTHNFNKKTGGFEPIAPSECAGDGNQQRAYNLFLRDMVDKYGGKPIPVTDAHFIDPEDKIIQDCLLKNGNSNGWYFQESYHQVQSEEIFTRLKTHLHDWLTEDRFKQWIENTYEVMDAAKSIDIKFDYHLPKIDIPDHIKQKTDDYNTQTYYYMMERIKEHGRWRSEQVYVDRFKKEVDVIMKNDTLNFIPYFLLYEDISRFTREQGILAGLARGSAGGSLMSYYLKVTHIDPIEADLPFERFLSHARIRAGSFPDIDTDIGDRARPHVMEYLKNKYGLGFAQIATFNTMKTKNAINDSMMSIYGRNRNDPEVMAIRKTISDSPQGMSEHDFLYGYTDKEGHYHAGETETNEKLANFFAQHPEVEKMTSKLIGMPRGWSRHASAFVISTLDIANTRVPTMQMKDDNLGTITVTQYNASMVENCGLVKADILGVKTLSTVSDTVDIVKKRTGIDYLEEDDKGIALIYRLPEDKNVYKDFFNKKTDSSFQFSTPLIKGFIQQFNPSQRSDLKDMTAICRPGALDAPYEDTTATQYYLDVKNNLRDVKYIHDDLIPFVKNTNGIIAYQEQIMAILVQICGYSLEESDQIRGAIAKKKEHVMLATFDRIRSATKERGWTPEQSDTLCQTILAFSRYSFNLSHSHAYAELGYITMYLKHHHKLEWWASVLNNEKSEDKMRNHIRLLGDIVTSPSMKHPTEKFDIIDHQIVAPIGSIKGVGPAVVNELISKGPFTNLKDYIDRVAHNKINVGAVGSLIKGRAADSFMDKGISYPDARLKFMSDYGELRGKRATKFKDELNAVDPLNIFLMERDQYKCFNKHLLMEQSIVDVIDEAWPALTKTGKSGVPFLFGQEQIPVICNINVAERIFKMHEEQQQICLILLFESSTVRSGVSKKSGRPWSLLSTSLSDGYNTIEVTQWDIKKPLKFKKNSIVFIRGKLKEGWKQAIAFDAVELVQVNIDEVMCEKILLGGFND